MNNSAANNEHYRRAWECFTDLLNHPEPKGTELLEEALTEIVQAAELQPEEPEVHYLAGMIYWQQGQLPIAAKNWEHTIKLDPTFRRAYGYLGTAYHEMGDIDRAIESFDGYFSCGSTYDVNEDPRPITIHFSLANCYFDKGNFEKAAEHFRACVSIAPDFQQAQYNLALSLYSLSRYEEALPPMLQAISLNPNHFSARAQLGVIYAFLQRFDEALRECELARSLRPYDPSNIISIGNISIELGDYLRAKESYLQALDLKSTSIYQISLHLMSKRNPRLLSTEEIVQVLGAAFKPLLALADSNVLEELEKAQESFDNHQGFCRTCRETLHNLDRDLIEECPDTYWKGAVRFLGDATNYCRSLSRNSGKSGSNPFQLTADLVQSKLEQFIEMLINSCTIGDKDGQDSQ